MYKYTDIEHENEMMNDFIESEMHKVQKKVSEGFNRYFAHSPISMRSLLLTISYAYFESYKHAEIVAQELNLGKLEFLAIAEDFEAFKETYLAELELAQNF